MQLSCINKMFLKNSSYCVPWWNAEQFQQDGVLSMQNVWRIPATVCHVEMLNNFNKMELYQCKMFGDTYFQPRFAMVKYRFIKTSSYQSKILGEFLSSIFTCRSLWRRSWDFPWAASHPRPRYSGTSLPFSSQLLHTFNYIPTSTLYTMH